MALSDQPNVLGEIYEDDVNIAIWQNSMSSSMLIQADEVIKQNETLNLVIAATPSDVHAQLKHVNELANQSELCSHIQILVDMFCTLFELKRAGLRLAILEKAMCPKFHVDRIPCRLVTTFSGPATEWLSAQHVDYSKLGKASFGLTDDQSGIYQLDQDIQKMNVGDVSLLKGTGWQNNEHTGLVHRSPAQLNNERRLVMTLDFID